MNSDILNQLLHQTHNEDDDDIVFVLHADKQVSAQRRPLKGDLGNLDFPGTLLLNKVCHAHYLIAATVCSINSRSKIIVTQRSLARCYASPKIPHPDIEFETLDVLDRIVLSPSESLLCVEIILTTRAEGEVEDLVVGDEYRSMRHRGTSVFEGSIEYADVVGTFRPLRLKKEISLRGPWGKGSVHLNASRPHFSLKEFATNCQTASITLEIFKIEMDWTGMQRIAQSNKLQ